jgi:hypothetical protein
VAEQPVFRNLLVFLIRRFITGNKGFFQLFCGVLFSQDLDSGIFCLGFFARGGGLPVNIDGGLKCFGHPVGASGLRMTYEIYKQLQGKADLPERQVKNPRLGLSHTFGGPPQISAVAILGNERG